VSLGLPEKDQQYTHSSAGVSLHLKEKELQISGDVIPMSLGTGSPLVNEKEAGVFLAKGCKVPPNSVMRVGAFFEM
jgi:hypothetical protein